MKVLILLSLALTNLQKAPLLSHGNIGNCLEECKEYYCPSDNEKDNKEKFQKDNNPKK